jgi:hypothetical protein
MRGESVPVKALLAKSNFSVGGTKINDVLGLGETSKSYEVPEKLTQ